MTLPIISHFGAYPFFIFLFWILILDTALFAESSNSLDVCNFETVTKSCSFFNPEGPDKIELKNGTSVPNLVV
ncbi:MAG: hypothetical protein ACKOA8_09115, partial [Deltaproteobacteria bacterium]